MNALNVRKFTDAPQQLSIKKEIAATPEEIWTTLSDHQGMTQWMPMIKSVDLVKEDDNGTWGEGCERHCQFGPDLLKERIVHWEAPYSYAYMIADNHLVKGHLGHFTIVPQNGYCLVTWDQYFYPQGMALKKWVMKNVMMPNVMKKALKNLGKKVA